jgi:hypothetical protein
MLRVPLNMFNAFVKLYNFSSLPTCPMLSSNSTTSLPSQQEGREVVELDESIEHVGREEKL